MYDDLRLKNRAIDGVRAVRCICAEVSPVTVA